MPPLFRVDVLRTERKKRFFRIPKATYLRLGWFCLRGLVCPNDSKMLLTIGDCVNSKMLSVSISFCP